MWMWGVSLMGIIASVGRGFVVGFEGFFLSFFRK